ncbi:MAG: hypothetical protein NUW07_02445, partial [Candidatus Saccharicenans sp.]|nr:hypothetical protein [Candidatus Saccharicenans sp.]
LPEWKEELWAGLMEKIARGKILVPGKSRSGLRGWRKLAPAAALVGLILISFLSYRLIDHFWPGLLTRPTASQNLPGASQSGEELNPVSRELEPEKEATIKAPERGPAHTERSDALKPPSRVEMARSQTPPAEKMLGTQNSIVSGAGKKAVPPVPTESGHQPAPQPERIEMAFILPETGVQILWILDRNFNLEGVKK